MTIINTRNGQVCGHKFGNDVPVFNSSEHGRSLRSMSDCGPVSLGEAVRLGTKDVSPALSLILDNDVTPQFLNHIDNHMVKLSK